ncbi:hypothetical protein E4U23_000745, partial [Claviceps purpurea]
TGARRVTRWIPQGLRPRPHKGSGPLTQQQLSPWILPCPLPQSKSCHLTQTGQEAGGISRGRGLAPHLPPECSWKSAGSSSSSTGHRRSREQWLPPRAPDGEQSEQ